MAWIMALIWAACCAGAAAAAMRKWVQPEREVSRRRWTAILAAAALGGAAAGWFTGNAGMILSYEVRCLAALALVGAGAVVDLHLRRIPNLCSLLLLAVGTVCVVLDFLLAPETAKIMLLYCLAGGVGMLVCLSLCRLISRGGIGIGDVKILSAAGFCLGLETGFLSLLAAQLLAVLAAIVLLVTKRAKWKDSLPFAPFLWAGLLLCLCLGITY